LWRGGVAPRLGVMEPAAKRKRKRYSEQERQQLLAAWRSSGESAARYGLLVGVNPSNLSRWATTAEGREGKALSGRPARRRGFVELRAASARLDEVRGDRDGVQFEVECPTGVRIRVFRDAAPEAIARLVGALGGTRAC
jgi:transposase-like protein